MRKFITLLLLIAGSFGGGYYMGQQPVGTLQKTVSDLSTRLEKSEKIVSDFQQTLKNLSRNALDTTLGIERDIRRRQGLVEAKSRLVQAKADVLDRNFGEAARELADAVVALETSAKDTKQDPHTDAVLDLASSLREVRLEVAMGKSIPMKKLEDVQKKMDQLLNK